MCLVTPGLPTPPAHPADETFVSSRPPIHWIASTARSPAPPSPNERFIVVLLRRIQPHPSGMATFVPRLRPNRRSHLRRLLPQAG